MAGREPQVPLPTIVCAVDDNFELPARVALHSLAAAHEDCLGDLRVVLLYDTLSADARTRIRTHGDRLGLKLELVESPPVDPRLPVLRRYTAAIYLRLNVHHVLADESRVLYLDSDLVVLQDLRELLTLPMDGHAIGAVRDSARPTMSRGGALPSWGEREFPADREYFNSGVLLLDLDACRSTGVLDRASDILLRQPDMARFPDQDALNWAAADHWLRLDRKWNTFAMSIMAARSDYVHVAEDLAGLDSLVRAERTASILHFSGRDKPWQDTCPPSWSRDRYREFLRAVEGPLR
ncbi:glycosyltransferase family 8 protein [Amycolatopsis sp. CA-128772]|uniref:glycosyltransferase family 8 protein n=1 Tax=Amycolatopsis sp. CA-128772 TaxID=2073159 RepID=UPI000CD1061E|nr:glycosyltransferase family 8 protein [Amycolatopsis sp. CA-128772]